MGFGRFSVKYQVLGKTKQSDFPESAPAGHCKNNASKKFERKQSGAGHA